jgi:hypothetical protein
MRFATVALLFLGLLVGASGLLKFVFLTPIHALEPEKE